jgi:hypothetical protein
MSCCLKENTDHSIPLLVERHGDQDPDDAPLLPPPPEAAQNLLNQQDSWVLDSLMGWGYQRDGAIKFRCRWEGEWKDTWEFGADLGLPLKSLREYTQNYNKNGTKRKKPKVDNEMTL